MLPPSPPSTLFSCFYPCDFWRLYLPFCGLFCRISISLVCWFVVPSQRSKRNKKLNEQNDIWNHLARWFIIPLALCWLSCFAPYGVHNFFGQQELEKKKEMQHRDGKVQSIRAGALCMDGHAQRTHTDIKWDECRSSPQRSLYRQLAHNQRDGTAPSNSSSRRRLSSNSSQQSPRNDCLTRRKTSKAEKRERDRERNWPGNHF